MSSPVRMCYTHIPTILTFEDGHFGGISAPLVDYLVEDANMSYVTVPENTYGVLVDLETRTYDGCIGSIQRNHSDLALVQVAAPVYGHNLIQGPSLGYDRISILSSYNERVPHVQQDFLSAVNCFTTSVWLLIGGASLVIIFLLIGVHHTCCLIANNVRSRHRFRSENKRRWSWVTRSVSHVVAKFLKQMSVYGMRRKVTFARLSIILTTLFFFWIHCFFLSLIKTELTIVPKPDTIESYDDLMAKNIQPIWIGALTDADLFRYAPRGSIEKRVWDFAVKKTGGRMEQAVVPPTSPDLISVIMGLATRKSALLVDRMMLHVMRENLCAGILSYALLEDILTHVAVDARSIEHVRVMAVSKELPEAGKSFLRRVTRLVEAGFVEESTKRTGILFKVDSPDKMRGCLLDQLLLKSAGVHPPGYLYYMQCVLICCVILIISGIVFASEWVIKRWCPGRRGRNP